MANPELSTITTVNGTTYDIKDAEARKKLESLQNTVNGGIMPRGTTTTALTDGAKTSPITIDGKSYTPEAGDIVFYNNGTNTVTFLYLVDGTWDQLGTAGPFKALAYKESASGSYTPSGTVTITPSTTTFNAVKSVGVLPSLSMSVENENLKFSFNPGSLPTTESKSAVTGATGSFSGTAGTVTVK